MADEKKERAAIVRKVIDLVRKRHFNLHGVDHQAWAKALLEREADLIAADRMEFEVGVQQALKDLKTSHTAFYSERPTRFPPQHTINATLSELDVNGAPCWTFIDVFEGGPAALAGIKPGDILIAADRTAPLPGTLPTFGIGKTHEVVIQAESGEKRVSIEVPFRKGGKERPPLVEPQAVTSKLVAPGVGLLKVLYFPGALGIRFGSELAQHVDRLKADGARKLVVDLRGNIGGSLGFAFLASYLCPDRRDIGFSLTPGRLRDGYEVSALPRVPMPKNRIEALTALGRFAFRDKSLMLQTQSFGPQPFHGQTVVLVNEWTSSAGEMAAAFGGDEGLANVIGHRTKGSVLGASNFEVSRGQWLRLPVFGWFTRTGTCLERAGVEPAIRLPSHTPELLRFEAALHSAVDVPSRSGVHLT